MSSISLSPFLCDYIDFVAYSVLDSD